MIERAEVLEVHAVRMPVMTLEDVMVTKLLALREHELDYGTLIEMNRAIRELVDWEDVRRRTEHSPFARAFFTLAEGIELVEPAREQTARS